MEGRKRIGPGIGVLLTVLCWRRVFKPFFSSFSLFSFGRPLRQFPPLLPNETAPTFFAVPSLSLSLSLFLINRHCPFPFSPLEANNGQSNASSNNNNTNIDHPFRSNHLFRSDPTLFPFNLSLKRKRKQISLGHFVFFY